MFSFKPFYHLKHFVQEEDKSLQDLLGSEKKFISLLTQVAEERRIAASHLVRYASPLGDDLSDVTKKLGNLFTLWSNVFIEFAGSCEQYRETIKTIGERDSLLTEGREKKKRLRENIERLQETRPDAVEKMEDLKAQLTLLTEATDPDEVEMGNFKRVASREALYLLLNGMQELSSKTDIIASFGKYIVDELEVTPLKLGEAVAEYQGTEKTLRIVKDATHALDNWKPDKAKVRRTLTSHHGRNPLIPPRTSSIEPNIKRYSLETTNNKPKESPESNTHPDTHQDDMEKKDTKETSLAVNDTPTTHLTVKHHSLRKPDESGAHPDPSLLPQQSDYNEHEAMPSSTHHPPFIMPLPTPTHPPPPHGLSHVYLGLLDHQKLYQFYQQYTPPKPYEEMARLLGSPAVFHPLPSTSQKSTRLGLRADPGGFVLPKENPNYLSPRPCVSASLSTSNSVSDDEKETT
ncbi:Eisosome component PIL1-domain-containing protein [Spinellus fusiger]|nr:Eisosome component PIL1-domain-containing protein [Spinellus fusiger]